MLSAACSHPRADAIDEVLAAHSTAIERVGWPGFDPAAIPVALFDGESTVLIGHPSPPPAFRRMRGASGALVADTAFDELRANTDLEFGGVRIAAVLIRAGRLAPDSIAATMIHEAFHAHQTQAHPGWTANEVDLFTYPVRALPALHLRRLETGALRRAVSARDSMQRLCWGHAFLRARGDRFSQLDDASVRYERATELREGLARYVEGQALAGEPPALPTEGYAPEDVRERAYETGRGIALLLDRTLRAWKDSLERGEQGSLDELLRRAIGSLRASRCGASPDEIARARTVARADLAALADRDRRDRDQFESAPGWRIEIVGDAEPLQPEYFDPLNVRVLADRHVFHGRWVRVASASVRAEVLDRTALTRGLPGHPLFAGLDRLWVTGLREPVIESAGDTTRVRAEGVTITAVGALVERDGQLVRITTAGPAAEDRPG